MQHTTACRQHFNTLQHMWCDSFIRVHLQATQCMCLCRCCLCRSVRCSVLQCVAVCCSVLQCVAVCCSVLQCVAVCRSNSQCADVLIDMCEPTNIVCAGLDVAVCCSMLQCVTIRCSVLTCSLLCAHLQTLSVQLMSVDARSWVDVTLSLHTVFLICTYVYMNICVYE